MCLVVGNIDTLQSVDVLGKTGFSDMRLPGLYGLHQGVVDEDVLVLRLDQVVPLLPDVEEVREDINVGSS